MIDTSTLFILKHKQFSTTVSEPNTSEKLNPHPFDYKARTQDKPESAIGVNELTYTITHYSLNN